jgi:hypothetical protein
MLPVSQSTFRIAPLAGALAIAALIAFATIAIAAQSQSSSHSAAAPAQSAPSAAKASAAAAPASASSATPSAKHAVTVTFNYDFTRTPACSGSVKKKCIALFNVYDVSGGAKNRIKLFTVPVPAGATKVANGISAKSPELVWEPGKHHLAVTAQMDNGSESTTLAATVWVTIPPPSSASPPSSPAQR